MENLFAYWPFMLLAIPIIIFCLGLWLALRKPDANGDNTIADMIDALDWAGSSLDLDD